MEVAVYHIIFELQIRKKINFTDKPNTYYNGRNTSVLMIVKDAVCLDLIPTFLLWLNYIMTKCIKVFSQVEDSQSPSLSDIENVIKNIITSSKWTIGQNYKLL